MNARRAHRLQIADRARKLGFQRVLVARVLDELAGAETLLLLHRLETLARTARQALAGELEARLVNLIARHQDGTGDAIELERDHRRAQRFGKLGGIAIGKIGIDRHVGRTLRPAPAPQADGDGGGDADQHRELAQGRNVLELANRR